MPIKSQILTLSVVLTMLVASANQAGIIVSTGPNAAIKIDTTFSTIPGTANLDALQGINDNFIAYDVTFSSLQSIDLVFTVTNSLGITGYDLGPFAKNSTGGSWTNYVIQLGFGTGSNFVQLASPNLEIDDAAHADLVYSSTAPTSAHALTVAWIGNATTTKNALKDMALSIDVPDLDPATLPSFAQVAGDPNSYLLTIRQTASTAPEPTSLVLLLLGGGALFRRQRR
jgi:hypothetical protein